jgi:autotransporter translocation and assembly factor TamB
MNRSKKITVAITVSVFLLLGFIFFQIVLTGIISERLKDPLSRKLGQWVNQDVEIGNLNTNIFSSLTISGLKIYQPGKHEEGLFLEIRKISVRYNIWRLLKTRDFNRSINEIVLLDPNVHLRYRQGQWNLSELLAGHSEAGHQLPYSLYINNGQVSFHDETGALDQIIIKKIQGTIRQRTKTQISFRLKAITSLSQNDRLNIAGTYIIPQAVISAEVSGKKISLQKIPQIFPALNLTKAQGIMSVNLDLRYHTLSRDKFTPLESSATVPSFLTGFTCQGTATVKEGEFWLARIPDPVREFSCTLQFDEKNLVFRKTAFTLANSSYLVSGSIFDYLNQPAADLKLRSAAFDLSDLSRIFPGTEIPHWNLAGTGKILLSANGPFTGLKINSDLNVGKGRIKEMAFADFRLQGLWQHNLLTVTTCQAKFAGGDLEAAAKIKLGSNIPLEIYALTSSWLHVDLAQLLGKNCTGSMDTYVTVKGIWPELNAKGRVLVNRISLADYALGPFDSTFKYQHQDLSFNGVRLNTKDTLRGVIGFREKLIQISNLGVDFNNGGKINIQGKIQTTQDKPVDLTLTGKNIPLEELSSLLGLSNIHGTVDSSGKMQGSWENPLTQLAISSNELSAGTHNITVAGEFLFTSEKLELTGLKINSASKIWGTVSFKPKMLVNLNFQPLNLELGILLSAAGFDSGGKLNGSTTGQMSLTGEPGKLEARGNFKIGDLALGDLSLGTAQSTVVFNQNKIFQGTISSIAKQGMLHTSWWLDLQKEKENKAEIIINFDRFQSVVPGNSYLLPQLDGRIKCTGWLKYNGQTDFSGDLSSEAFTINKQPQEITGRISGHKEQVLLKAQLGKAYVLETTIVMQDQPSLNGSLKVNIDNIAQANTIWQIKALSRVSGPLQIEADITGTLADPVIKGNLAIGNGSWRALAFDQVTGLWRCQDGIFYLTNLELKKGPGEYLATGKIPFNEESPWWLSLQVDQAEVANLVQLVTDPADTKGQMQAEVKVTGTRQKPLITGNVLVHNFSYAGLAPSEVSSDFKINNGILTFETLLAEGKESKVYLEKGGTLIFGEQGKVAFNGNLSLRNIKLNEVMLFGDLAIKGEKEDFTIFFNNFWINQHQFSGEKIRLNWQDDKIEFLPVANKEKLITGTILKPAGHEYVLDKIVIFEKGKSVAQASGRIRYPQNISLFMNTQEEGISAGLISELLDLKLPVSGRTLFNLEIQGPWSKPEIDCSFQSYEGKIGGLDYNSFSGEFNVKNDLVTLAAAELRGNKRYRVQAKGTIPLKEQGNYNLQLSLPDSSCELLSVWPGMIKKAKGPLAAELTITGKKSSPVLNGTFSIDHGELYPAKMVKRITAAQVKLRITDNKIYIGSCSALVGDSPLEIAGYVDLGMSTPGDFDLTMNFANKRGMQIAIPGFIERGEIAGEVHAFGQLKDYQLTGTLLLTNTHLTYPPKKSAGGLSATDWLDYAHWNLEINGGENTWYENELVEVNVKGKLVFTGPTAALNVSGRVEAVRGTLQYLGNDFRIREAALDFYNNTAYLAGLAEAQVAQDMVILTVDKNKLDDMHPHFSSRNDPQMTEQKVISMLVYGPEINRLAGEEQNKVLVKEMLKIIDTTLNTRVIKPVVKNLGLDRVIDVVRIRTEVTQRAAEGTASPVWKGSSVSIGKYLGSRVFLGYNTILEEELNTNKLALKHQVEMDYHLKGSKYLKMRIDEKERFMGIENQIRF